LQKFEHAKSVEKNEILNPQNCSKMIIQTILKVQKKEHFQPSKSRTLVGLFIFGALYDHYYLG